MNNEHTTQDSMSKAYANVSNMLINEKKSPREAILALTLQGVDEKTAKTIVESLAVQIDETKKERAKKDMFYGALWCIGGTIATLADVGFIFWGAILFGAVQFIKGMMDA